MYFLNLLGNVCSIVGLIIVLFGRTVKADFSVNMKSFLLSISFRIKIESSNANDKLVPK